MSPSDFKAWRERLGLSKAEAARQLGLSSRVISYYENGRRIPKTVEVLCLLFESKPDLMNRN